MEARSHTTRGPLSVVELGRVLRLAAEVADADCEHDLLTALDVLNKDKLRPAGEPQLYEAELRQIAGVLHAEFPAHERVGDLGSDVAGVNAWLSRRARDYQRFRADGSDLAALFRQAAARLEQTHGGELDG